jgi:hypothetical protein
MPKERVVLKHEPNASLRSRMACGVLPLEKNRSRISALKPRDDSQKGRLSRAGRSEQSNHLAMLDVEANSSDGLERAVGLVNVSHLNAHDFS